MNKNAIKKFAAGRKSEYQCKRQQRRTKALCRFHVRLPPFVSVLLCHQAAGCVSAAIR